MRGLTLFAYQINMISSFKNITVYILLMPPKRNKDPFDVEVSVLPRSPTVQHNFYAFSLSPVRVSPSYQYDGSIQVYQAVMVMSEILGR